MVRRLSFSAHTGRYLSAECSVEDVCLFRHFIADGCVIISSCKDTASQPVWRTIHHTALVFSERPLLPTQKREKRKRTYTRGLRRLLSDALLHGLKCNHTSVGLSLQYVNLSVDFLLPLNLSQLS